MSMEPTCLDFLHQSHKAGAIKTGSADTIVCKVDGVRETMLGSIAFEELFLIGYAVALALLVIVTAETLIQGSNLSFAHFLLLSFLTSCVF